MHDEMMFRVKYRVASIFRTGTIVSKMVVTLILVCASIPSNAILFAQTLKTDFGVYPEPPRPSLGSRGSKIIDPTFGTTILRVTDSSDGPFGRVLYSTYPSVNANSTRLFGNVSASGQTKLKLWDLDAVNFVVSNGRLPGGMPNIEQYFAQWSGSNPDMLYGGGGGCVCVWYYNVATNSGGKLFDITGRVPGYQSSQVQRSVNDDVWSMNLLDSGGRIIGYAAYKRSSNTVLISSSDTSTNETYVDKSGSYFYWLNNSCSTKVYDITALPARFIGATTLCHNGPGSGIAFYSSGTAMNTLKLSNLSSTIEMSGYFWQTTQSHHLSLNSTNESYALVSRHCSPNPCTVTAAFDKELVLVSTTTNAVKRIAHHRSETGTGYNYYDTPFANISPDGQFVAFTSNWGGTSGHNRQDLYLVKIASGGVAAKPPSPTGLTVN